MKNMIKLLKCVSVVLFFTLAVCAGESSKLDLVRLQPGQSVFICSINERFATSNLVTGGFFLALDPMGLYDNQSDDDYLVGVDMSLYTTNMFSYYVRSSSGEVLSQSTFTHNTVSAEFTEVSTQPYEHRQIKQNGEALKFISLIREAVPKPSKESSGATATRIVFMVGSYEDIVNSYEIPRFSRYNFLLSDVIESNGQISIRKEWESKRE